MKETLNIMFAFIFIGGTLLFLFGAMVLKQNIMWLPSLICFIIAIYFAVMGEVKQQLNNPLPDGKALTEKRGEKK